MKYLNTIVMALLLSSCCNTKKAVKQKPKADKKEVAEFIKPEVQVITEKTNDSVYYIKNAKVVEAEDLENPEYYFIDKKATKQPKSKKKDSMNFIAGHKAKTFKEKNSSLTDNGFHQNLTKRTSSNVHQIWNELLQANVSEQGNVDYKAFKSDHEKLLGYVHILNLMKSHEKFDSFSRNKKLAYWINAYNALTIDLILRNYPVKSIKDIKKPWEQRLWKLDEKWYNLEDIEHKILRKMDEPRIHFAIVCASYSCPKLQNEAFTADKLEAQLTIATKEFLSDTNRNEISQNSLNISKIFKWFSKDFKQNGSLIDFINKYTTTTISEDAKISYKDYNWDLNN